MSGRARVPVTSTARRGFALLAVLWTLVGVAALAAGASLVARDAVSTARNRIALTRAAWLAEQCTERARATMEGALARDSGLASPTGAWNNLDRIIVRAAAATPACAYSVQPVGARLDLNVADGPRLRRFLTRCGVPPTQADSLADALLDWRDDDDDARTYGSERDDYVTAGRPPPRNGPLADIRELRRVRGFDALPLRAEWVLWGAVGVEHGRTDLSHATPPVLASLPGFTLETVERVMALQADGAMPRDLLALASLLAPVSRDSLTAHYSELVSLAVMEPEAWLLSARAGSGDPRITVALELRLARSGSRAAITRRREWME
jgi:general secretion pathway protein K